MCTNSQMGREREKTAYDMQKLFRTSQTAALGCMEDFQVHRSLQLAFCFIHSCCFSDAEVRVALRGAPPKAGYHGAAFPFHTPAPKLPSHH